jgi:hypothetical protein
MQTAVAPLTEESLYSQQQNALHQNIRFCHASRFSCTSETSSGARF